MICRNCGTEIADKAIVCYRCGTATAGPRMTPGAPPKPRRARLAVTLSVIVVAVVIAALYTFACPSPIG